MDGGNYVLYMGFQMVDRTTIIWTYSISEISASIQKEEDAELKESANSRLLQKNYTDDTNVKSSSKRSKLHAFTMTLALSVHSVFEGLALGLEVETSQVRN